MATVLATGRDLVFKLATQDASPQTAEVTLEFKSDTETIQTLAGPASYSKGEEGTLKINFLQDWEAADSFCGMLWDGSIDGTPIEFTLDFKKLIQFGGSVIPVKPTVGGKAEDALQSEIELAITGTVTKTAITPPAKAAAK